jgi:hypothetical protein
MMALTDTEKYVANLRHVRRPDQSSERASAPSITLPDYQGLYMSAALREYAAYYAPTQEHKDIAEAYAEYIDMVVRGEGRVTVTLYAHTSMAKEVLFETITTVKERNTDAHEDILHEVQSLMADEVVE